MLTDHTCNFELADSYISCDWIQREGRDLITIVPLDGRLTGPCEGWFCPPPKRFLEMFSHDQLRVMLRVMHDLADYCNKVEHESRYHNAVVTQCRIREVLYERGVGQVYERSWPLYVFNPPYNEDPGIMGDLLAEGYTLQEMLAEGYLVEGTSSSLRRDSAGRDRMRGHFS